MTDLIQLKEGSYKGVEMIVKSMPTNGGRRISIIRYPRSDKQSIEDQGLIPRQFSINGIVPHENYEEKKAALLRVFEDGEKGSLVHPTFGLVENVKNGKYSLDEITSALGKAQYTVEFFIDDAVGVPISSGSFASQVQTASDALNVSLSQDLIEGYEVTSSFVGNFADAARDAVSVGTEFVEAIDSSFQIVEGAVNEFVSEVNAFNSSINAIIQAPEDFANRISSMFNSLNNLYDSTIGTFQSISTMFDFGDDNEIFKQNTAGRIERQKNQDLVRANIKAQSLSYVYLAAVQIDFESEEDLALVNDQLETQYSLVRDNELLSNESLLKMDELRIQANSALSQILLNTRKIITINTRLIPLSVLVFDFYGSTELVGVISNLNAVKQNAFVEGDVRILTE